MPDPEWSRHTLAELEQHECVEPHSARGMPDPEGSRRTNADLELHACAHPHSTELTKWRVV